LDKVVVNTDKAPQGRVRLTQAIKVGEYVYCSGQIPIDPKTGRIVNGDIRVQTRQVMENLKAILEAAGSSLSRAVKVTIFMSNLEEDFDGLNRVFNEYFPTDPPARSTVEVSRLVFKEARVEIELIATL